MKVQQLKDVKEKETKIEKQLDAQRNKVSELKTQIATKETEKEHLLAEIDRLTEEITDMQDRKAFWDTLGACLSWIDHLFIGLVDSIETHFLARMHQQFDPRFRKWFNFLIDEEGLNARVDRKFTPVILQEGYEAPYTTLSGGERASVALAYRLALNTVINTQIENIRTKDVIILDEPTDGFSDQQLDKVRDIIHRIDIPQIIIVSHERKVKDYVDKTIEIQKEEGVSRQVS
ncbi:MAG: hypothetical protein GWO20_17865 [Candidatus Korarchaeota archaeon]|nr:hypothetical protein [Candidatus Korarchaeota archaeon]NIU85182.1 hypothetical protein [Candidatus Thorarchaeota archaeon]NIW15271.1 hypothetical protein [Candidatus Thorarchaeota archaeon]